MFCKTIIFLHNIWSLLLRCPIVCLSLWWVDDCWFRNITAVERCSPRCVMSLPVWLSTRNKKTAKKGNHPRNAQRWRNRSETGPSPVSLSRRLWVKTEGSERSCSRVSRDSSSRSFGPSDGAFTDTSIQLLGYLTAVPAALCRRAERRRPDQFGFFQ